VRDFVKFIGETNLIEYFHCGRMNGVAAEFAIEVLVHFEERDVDAAAREKQREHRSARAATDDAAGGALHADNGVLGLGLGRETHGFGP